VIGMVTPRLLMKPIDSERTGMLRADLHTVLEKNVFPEKSICKQISFIHNYVIIVLLRNDLIVLQVRSDI
jgi:hypothetical protein